MYWGDKKILVTGGDGFLGKHLINLLREVGCTNIFVPLIEQFDLRVKEDIVKLYQAAMPDIVIHLAARVGGISANKTYPGEFFYDNLIMGIQLIEYARQFNISKFVALGTICAYPKYTPVPFKEEDLWNGYPEETNAPYGLAKKMLLVQAQAYRKQYGFNAIYLLPVNLYGPGDNFDPASSHVIPAMIRKFVEAVNKKEKEVIVWGTGNATREFLYVEDCARAICMATEKYNSPEPVNIGAGFEISMRDLAQLIARLTGFTGNIVWDKSMPDGQPQRRLDTERAKKEFGFEAKADFNESIKKTIAWYKASATKMKIE